MDGLHASLCKGVGLSHLNSCCKTRKCARENTGPNSNLKLGVTTLKQLEVLNRSGMIEDADDDVAEEGVRVIVDDSVAEEGVRWLRMIV